MNWQGKNVLVTGGASFIGSHLVEAIVDRGAAVRVVDNLSSGSAENLRPLVETDRIQLVEAELREPGVADAAVADMDYVFHLAADHGGRGYVNLHQAACVGNLVLDGLLFAASATARVEKVVYASSACVYPNYLQTDPDADIYLAADLVGPPYDADTLYGWAKLMGEFTLRAYYRERRLRSVSCRYFTVYGERGHENHAVIAMIARAFVHQNPFVVWGNGQQVRNWTHVDDIVEGTIRAAEVIEDGSAVNLGTMERTRVIEAAHEILRYTGHGAQIELHPEMPAGPMNRVADNTLARKLLRWRPTISFLEGLHRTVDWYFTSKDPDMVAAKLSHRLTER